MSSSLTAARAGSHAHVSASPKKPGRMSRSSEALGRLPLVSVHVDHPSPGECPWGNSRCRFRRRLGLDEPDAVVSVKVVALPWRASMHTCVRRSRKIDQEVALYPSEERKFRAYRTSRRSRRNRGVTAKPAAGAEDGALKERSPHPRQEPEPHRCCIRLVSLELLLQCPVLERRAYDKPHRRERPRDHRPPRAQQD
jgi:hypothetical protein